MQRAQQLSEKTMVVTGATHGIGKETARAVARMGARTLIVGRNAERAAQVVDAIQAESGNKEVIFYWAICRCNAMYGTLRIRSVGRSIELMY